MERGRPHDMYATLLEYELLEDNKTENKQQAHMQWQRCSWPDYDTVDKLLKEEGQVIVCVCSVKNTFITDTQLKKGKACWHCSLTLTCMQYIHTCMCGTKEEDLRDKNAHPNIRKNYCSLSTVASFH